MTQGQRDKPDIPNFGAWNLETLVRFAQDAYLKLQAQEAAIEQLRLDLKDAMKMLRQRAKNAEDDWK